jgi:hypothetical protein
MSVLTRGSFAVAATIAALWVALASPSLASVQDYEFQLVQGEVKKGDGAIIHVVQSFDRPD